MNFRDFGKTGEKVSEIGLGCWQLGGADWGDVDDDAALRILHEAVDGGVTFLDTANVYGGGRSEALIGKFLKQRPGSLFVATKAGRESMYPDGYTREALQSAVDSSLERLGTDSLDLLQLHCIPAKILEQGEIFSWLDDLKTSGKIRHFGASVESVHEAELSLKHPGLSSLQIIFNIFRQTPAETLLSQAAASRISIIVRLPFASGLLSGAVTAGRTFPENDHRNYNRNGEHFNVGETFAGLPMDVGLELTQQLDLFRPEGLTPAQFALRWILDHPEVTTVIPGASKPSQASANNSASSLPGLPKELHEQLADFFRRKVKPALRGPD